MSGGIDAVGAALVGLALMARDQDGEPVAYRGKLVLVKMALVALDDDLTGERDPVYFAGWADLAEALGYAAADYGPAAERAVARALADLRAAGLVTVDEPSTRRRNATYRLHLGVAFRRLKESERNMLAEANGGHNPQVVESVDKHSWVRDNA